MYTERLDVSTLDPGETVTATVSFQTDVGLAEFWWLENGQQFSLNTVDVQPVIDEEVEIPVIDGMIEFSVRGGQVMTLSIIFTP